MMLNLRFQQRAARRGRGFLGRGLILAALSVAILQLALVVPAASADPVPSGSESPSTAEQILAQADPNASRPLEPRYQPREPEEKSWYNDSYIFAMSRGLADSTIAPAGKAPLFLFTVPLDIAFLPFALIGGLFG